MARLTLNRTKPDPDKQYEPVMSFSGPHGTFNTGTRLSGDHEAVRASFGSWMLASLPDDEKGRLRTTAMFGNQDVPAHATHAEPPLAEPPLAEPPSGKFRALVSRRLPPDLASRGRISPGDVVSADDETYRRFPHLFTPYEENR